MWYFYSWETVPFPTETAVNGPQVFAIHTRDPSRGTPHEVEAGTLKASRTIIGPAAASALASDTFEMQSARLQSPVWD